MLTRTRFSQTIKRTQIYLPRTNTFLDPDGGSQKATLAVAVVVISSLKGSKNP